MFHKNHEQYFHDKDLFNTKEDKKKFSRKQIRAMREAFYAGIPINFIKKYCNPVFSARQLEEIYNGYWLEDSERNQYANDTFDGNQMEEIRIAFEHKLDQNKISHLVTGKYNAKQMEQIRLALEYNYTKEELSFILNPKLSWIQMLLIRRGIEEEITLPYIKLYAKKNWLEMWQILQAIREGIPYSVISDFSDSKWYTMFLIRMKFVRYIMVKDFPIFVLNIINE